MSRAKAKEQLSFVKPDFTDRQGQFLAFIYQYRILNKRAPAEADFMQFFQLTPPSVHSMILTLERRGFISRVPGQPRSITLLISPGSLPPLGTGQKPSVPQPEKTDQKPGGWITLRQKLATLEKPALIALLHNLFELAGVNRDFMHARFDTGREADAALEKYRGKIVAQFFPARGEGQLKMGETHRAVSDYRKATGNLAGTAELLMTYIENATRFTDEFGDIDAPFYNSIESALDELAALLRGEARGLYPQFRERLADVEQIAGDMGWGFGEYVKDVVGELEKELGGQNDR
jgi:hypothetical protein